MSKTFDRAEIQQIRNEIDQALTAIAAKHNVNFKLGTIRFDNSQMRATLKAEKVATVATVNSNSGVATTNAVSISTAHFLRQFGLDPNKKYSTAAGVVQFIDYVPRRYKYPFVVQVVGSTKRFKLSEIHARLATEVK
jgi:hypothetical protein